MKISEKEKLLLGFVLIGAIGVSYYYLGYKPKVEKINEARIELEDANTKYTKMQSEIANIEKNENAIVLLNDSIKEGSKKIYPDIKQEKLIKELTDLWEKAGITVTPQFTPITYAPISEYFISKEEEQVMANSLDALIEEYNANLPEGEKKVYKKELGAKNGVDIEEKEKKPAIDKEKANINVQQMIVTIGFEGKYENLLKFIKSVEDYNYLVAIPDITITPVSNDVVSGQFTMEFYSAPRIDGDFDDYYMWQPEGKSGKDNPYTDGYTNIPGIQNEDAEDVTMNVSLRPSASDMPSVSVGRANDSVGRTILKAKSNKTEEVTIEFTQKGDEYFVEYSLGSQVYPEAGAIDFTPKGNIKVNVTSEKRMNLQDKSAVKLNVKNSTDKRVDVFITNDDKDSPRVNMNVGENVYYTSK